ncbi:unnamed protein product [Scytosiphon promiscuus]
MALVAKGYRVVPQTVSGGNGFRHVHLKEHKGVFKTSGSSVDGKGGREVVFARGKTLFVGNVDDQGGRLCRKRVEDRLRRALSSCGKILHVQASKAPPVEGAGGTETVLAGAGAAEKTATTGATRFAHVCFSSAKGVQEALALDELASGISDATKMETDEGEEGGQEGSGEPDDVENRDENGDETCGYAALIQRHRRKFPPREALLDEVDSRMHRFEQAEAAEMAKRKALLEKPEDDDGFVTVTYKRKRGRNSGGDGNPAGGGGMLTAGGAKKKRKGAGELSDFYRFQMRETRREQLATLRSKFEQDKARVAKLKEQRKFRPF